MNLLGQSLANLGPIALWGLIASAVLTTLQAFTRSFGLSRINLPFIFGTVATRNRQRAEIFGMIFYIFGGTVFSFGYALVFLDLGHASWWSGALLGTFHGVFLAAVFLPLVPNLHTAMNHEYGGLEEDRPLEPPGFLGLNYGRRTPETIIVTHAIYGAILGATLPP